MKLSVAICSYAHDIMMKKVIAYREAGVFFTALLIFSVVIFFLTITDINSHADYIGHVIKGTMKPPANFLYYLIIYCAAFFQTKSVYLYSASAVVLSVAVTAKFMITRNIIASCTFKTSSANDAADRFITVISAMLILVFSIPTGMLAGGHYYLGHITPTVWHNSTTIFLMPFALLLFWVSYQQLIAPTNRRMLFITMLCILNILIKPSFYFVFCIAYPLMLLRSFGIRKKMWANLIPVLTGSALLLAEYILIYTYDYGNAYTEKVTISISPFSIWSHFTPNIPLALTGSLLFPLVYLLFYGRDLMNNLLLQYAALAYMIALVIFSVFSETGPRQFSGNFYWQCIVSAYILFMVAALLTVGKVVRARKSGTDGPITLILETNWKNKILLSCFFLHTIAGIVFLGYLITLGKTVGS